MHRQFKLVTKVRKSFINAVYEKQNHVQNLKITVCAVLCPQVSGLEVILPDIKTQTDRTIQANHDTAVGFRLFGKSLLIQAPFHNSQFLV